MKENIRNLQTAFIIAFALVAGGLLYWQLFRADDLLARDDNLRRVIAEQRIKRGKIFAANGIALAESITNADGLSVRRYPYPNLATVTGYYSLRYGTGGLESAFDDPLRGTDTQSALDEFLHRPSVGQSITVTIDLPIQIAADTGLANADATGSAVVLNARTGKLMAMASSPTFDPNRLDEDWDTLSTDPTAPLLNRAAQGLFPLGELSQLAQSVADLMGISLDDAARQLYFDRDIPFSLPTAKGVIPNDLPQKVNEIAVTPLHVAWLASALANGGSALPPSLIQTDGSSTPLYFMSAEKAAALRAQYADFSALADTDVTGADPLSWYIGIRGEMVVVVAVTSPTVDRDAARRIGQLIFSHFN